MIIENPCVNNQFVWITGPFDLPAETYGLTSPAKFWSHTPFTLNFYPEEHNLCGTIHVFYQTDLNDIVPGTISYDPAIQTFTLQGDSTDLVGEHPYTVNAVLMSSIDFFYQDTLPVGGTITIFDPCYAPDAKVTATIQPDPAVY